jgi:hypothetical protein
VLTLVGDGLWRWFHGKERPAAGCRQWWLGGSVGGAVGQCELAGEVWGGEEVALALLLASKVGSEEKSLRRPWRRSGRVGRGGRPLIGAATILVR